MVMVTRSKKTLLKKGAIRFQVLTFWAPSNFSTKLSPSIINPLSLFLCLSLSPARKLILSSNYETCQEFAPTEM